MVEKKEKKVGMREEDVCSLLQRYQAATILSVLREVAQHPDPDINWESMLVNTSSGIKSARELQLLWRHLAYRRPLVVQGDDDESDLEVELEAYPPPTSEAALEAAACVKVLACAPPSELNDPDTHHPPPPPPPHPLCTRKRKWSLDEDSQLLAAVSQWGEGNWSSILKHGHWSRSASQLSQRWSHIRKKHSPLLPPSSSSSSAPHLSEAQLATRRALDLALKDNLTTPPTPTPKPALSHSQPPTPSFKPPATSFPKPRPPIKKPPPKPPSITDTIQRTAVAAGARILNPSDADALLNYANVHFFRSRAPVSFPTPPQLSKDSHPPPPVSHPLKPKPPAPDDHLPKNDNNKTCHVPCSEAKQIVRLPDNIASLPQTLPKAPPVKSRSIPWGTTANEGKDEPSNQVVVDPVLTDAAHNQASCTPSVNGTHESFSSSVVDASTEKVKGLCKGLAEAK
ncbi:hypothetical protein RND81_03G242100 [Saponaria officinalis]|uniref:Uncharacterized protein n=1 Tax=Saponaria officinalis TaxID=3572 RepID=A0AAW1MAV0_SAPOF